STLMPATVTVSRLPIFRHRLKTGSMFTLRGFLCGSLQSELQAVRLYSDYSAPRSRSLLGLANTNIHIPDVDTSPVYVTSSLFESQAVSFHNKLECFGDPKVVVATSINPKIVGGCHVRDIYFSTKRLMQGRLISKYSGNNPAPSLLRGYAKVEPLSISELNQFVITGKPQRRLQELMETRQEEDIKELQTSLEEANKSLHVTASEASW
ncbi:hypothetical protein HID58_040792, partial [Brassica napus]